MSELKKVDLNPEDVFSALEKDNSTLNYDEALKNINSFLVRMRAKFPSIYAIFDDAALTKSMLSLEKCVEAVMIFKSAFSNVQRSVGYGNMPLTHSEWQIDLFFSDIEKESIFYNFLNDFVMGRGCRKI